MSSLADSRRLVLESHFTQPGTILFDKYRVEGVLGYGGMGVVIAATHIQLEERVAIKFLAPSTDDDLAATHDPETVERFVREGRSAIKIRSEHCVRILDVGALPDGSPFMVMEHLEGDDLKKIISTLGQLSVEEAIEYVLQAGEAIAEAHKLGIVHRDIKPANLFLSHRADGSACVKILDFGISKQASTSEELSITSTQTVLGSPMYMSPEQLRSSRSADARADIWGLATVLYELLAGTPPFSAASMSELCVKIVTDDPPPIRDSRRDLAIGVDEVIAKALTKNRNFRYQTMAEFATALAPFGSERALMSARRISAVLQTTEPSVSTCLALGGRPSGTPPPDGSVSSPDTTVARPSPSAVPAKVDHATSASVTSGTSSVSSLPQIPRRSNMPLIVGALAVFCALAGMGAGIAVSRAPETSAKTQAPAPEPAESANGAKSSDPVVAEKIFLPDQVTSSLPSATPVKVRTPVAATPAPVRTAAVSKPHAQPKGMFDDRKE